MIDLESIDGFMRSCQDKNGNLNGRFFKKYITKECEQILSENDILPAQLFYLWKNGINEIPKCQHCGKPLNHKSHFHKRNSNFCSRKCSTSYEGTKEKTKNTNIERYGTKHPMYNPKIKQKCQDSLFKNYGVTHPMYSEEIKNTMKKTMIEKYGDCKLNDGRMNLSK